MILKILRRSYENKVSKLSKLTNYLNLYYFTLFCIIRKNTKK